jgi:hypothetical protein
LDPLVDLLVLDRDLHQVVLARLLVKRLLRGLRRFQGLLLRLASRQHFLIALLHYVEDLVQQHLVLLLNLAETRNLKRLTLQVARRFEVQLHCLRTPVLHCRLYRP